MTTSPSRGRFWPILKGLLFGMGINYLPRFSIRTLLILVAMLAILLAQWPWTEKAPVTGGSYYELPKYRTELTDRFKYVAAAEGVVLAVWAGAALIRRRRGAKSA